MINEDENETAEVVNNNLKLKECEKNYQNLFHQES